MKIEIGKDFPQYFKPSYPEEFELFSHFEVTAGIPTVLFAITTWKENGKMCIRDRHRGTHCPAALPHAEDRIHLIRGSFQRESSPHSPLW